MMDSRACCSKQHYVVMVSELLLPALVIRHVYIKGFMAERDGQCIHGSGQLFAENRQAVTTVPTSSTVRPNW